MLGRAHDIAAAGPDHPDRLPEHPDRLSHRVEDPHRHGVGHAGRGQRHGHGVGEDDDRPEPHPGPTEHRSREIQSEDRPSPPAETQGHDAGAHTDLENRSLPGRKVRVDVPGVLLAPLLTPAGLVVVLGDSVELGPPPSHARGRRAATG